MARDPSPDPQNPLLTSNMVQTTIGLASSPRQPHVILPAMVNNLLALQQLRRAVKSNNNLK